jgi:hypothetical protein
VPVQSKANQKKAKNESKSTCQQNYSNAEDVQLCNLWLDVAQDSVIGINQTGNGFWTCVAKKYLKVLPEPIQTSVGLKNRWATLQGAINKFSSCVQQITYANQSGTTNEDRLTYALRLYAENQKKAFAHLNCYNILVDAPK